MGAEDKLSSWFGGEEFTVHWQAMATILFSRSCGMISVLFPASIQFCSWVCMEMCGWPSAGNLQPDDLPWRDVRSRGCDVLGLMQIKESLNHRMAGVVRYLKDRALPTPCNGQGCHPLGQTAQSLVAEEPHFYSV